MHEKELAMIDFGATNFEFSEGGPFQPPRKRSRRRRSISLTAAVSAALAWLALAAAPAFAQSTSFGASQNAANLSGLRTLSMADIDGDGDMDLVAYSRALGEVYWHENLGGASFAAGVLISNTQSSTQGIAGGDLDGDGAPDVVASGETGGANGVGKLTWYRNLDGLGDFGAPAASEILITDNPLFVSDVEWLDVADIDGDGDLDIVTAGEEAGPGSAGAVVWHENANGDASVWNSSLVASVQSIDRAFAADVDGDGDIDVVSASDNGSEVAWHENANGDGSTWTTRVVGAAFNNAFCVSVGDLNGDGDPDILAGGSGRLTWFENSGAMPPAWTPHDLIASGANADDAFPADLDLDGDLDVMAALGNDIVWFENLDGAGTFGPQNVLASGSGASYVRAADLDADCDPDVFYAFSGSGLLAYSPNLLGGSVNCLGDSVWHDRDGDGVREPGEHGVRGARVNLLDAGFSQIDTTTTDRDGFYHFPSQAPGTYTVEFTVPAGYSGFTAQNAGSATEATDSDAALGSGRSDPVTLASSDRNVSVDAGLLQGGPVVPEISFAPVALTVNEGAGTATINVALSTSTSVDVTADIVLTGMGDAAADSDFSVGGGLSVMIPAGMTAGSATVAILDDMEDEFQEFVEFGFANVTNAFEGSSNLFTLNIDDNDEPMVNFAATSGSRSESMAGTLMVDVLVSPPSVLDVTADVMIAAGNTATPGSDFNLLTAQVLVPAGMASGQVQIQVLDDAANEPSEMVGFVLQNPTGGAAIGAGNRFDLTILDDDNSSLSFALATSSGFESAPGILSFNVTVSPVSTSTITADVALDPASTATAGADFNLITTALAIPPGMATGQVQVEILDDAIDEPAEIIILRLQNISGATAGANSSFTLAIGDNDQPLLNFSPSTSGSVSENPGGPFSMSVEVSPASFQDVVADVAILAGDTTPGSDFTLTTAQVMIPAGMASGTVEVSVLDDAINELDETVQFFLQNATGAMVGSNGSFALTILDDDDSELNFAMATGNASEATPGIFSVTVNLSPASPVQVMADVAVLGSSTASAGTDYVLLTPQLSLAPGATSGLVRVEVRDDNIDEFPEVLNLQLQNATGAIIGANSTFDLTIADNEEPALSFAAASRNVGEGAGTVMVNVTVSPASVSPVTADIALNASSTATLGADFTLPATSISIPAGQGTAQFSVAITDDMADEVREFAIFEFQNVSGAVPGAVSQHALGIDDNDSPEIVFSEVSRTVGESAGTISVQVELSQPSAQPVTVNVDVLPGGSATEASDFNLLTPQVMFAPPATTATVMIQVLDDAADELQEFVNFQLSSPSGGANLGGNDTFALRIDDNDDATLSFAMASASVSESPSRVFSIVANVSPPSSVPVTADVALVPGTATSGADFNLIATQLMIPAGASQGSVLVEILDDSLDEPDETLGLMLSNVTGATLGTPSAFTLTLADNEEPQLSFANMSRTVAEGVGTIMVSVSVVPPSRLQVTADIAALNTGGAMPGVDFNLLASSITIPPMQSTAQFAVEIVDDMLDEPLETASLELSNVSGATLGLNDALALSITDNDAPVAEFAMDTLAANENAGTVSVNVTVSPPSLVPVTADVVLLAGNTATPGSDFNLLTASVTVPAGMASAPAQFQILDDNIAEPLQFAAFQLQNLSGALSGPDDRFRLEIIDNEQPQVQMAAPTATVLESAGMASFGLTLSSPSKQPVTVDVILAGGDAVRGQDYNAPNPSRITFAAGMTAATFTVEILDDAIDEFAETISLDLANAQNATVGANHALSVQIDDNDEPPFIQFQAAASTADEIASNASVNVALVNAAGQSVSSGKNVTVEFGLATPAGTATQGADYNFATAPPGPLTIPPGARGAAINVQILADLIDEPAETVLLGLLNPANATLNANASHALTIIDNDPAPLARFSMASAAVTEDGAVNPTQALVTLDRPSSQLVSVVFSLSGTALAGDDYTVSPSAPNEVFFAPGETQAAISLNVNADNVSEPDETAILTLTSVGQGSAAIDPGARTFALLIFNDDANPVAGFSAPDSTFDEGTAPGMPAISVTLTRPASQQIALQYSVGGSATLGPDYALPAPFTVSFAPGQTSRSIPLTVLADNLVEGDEVVTLSLVAASGPVIVGPNDFHALTIEDDDEVPFVMFGQPSSMAGEADGTASVAVTISREPGEATTVDYAVAASSATEGLDFSLPAIRRVTFMPGGPTTQNIPVSILQDAISEPTETVLLDLASATNAFLGKPARHELTILDDEPTPAAQWSNALNEFDEGAGAANLTMTLSPASSEPVAVNFARQNESANLFNPDDYNLPASGSVTFQPGQTSANLQVVIVEDALNEIDESAEVAIQPGSGYGIASIATATFAILDNDDPPSAFFDPGSLEVREDIGSAMLSVKLDAVAGIQAVVTVDATGGTATNGADYNFASTQVVFLPGETEKSISVPIVDEDILENDETIVLSLSAPVESMLGAPSQATITILKNDPLIQVFFEDSAAILDEQDALVNATHVRLTQPVEGPVSVDYVLIDGTATNGADYAFASGSLVFQPGESRLPLPVQLFDDAISEQGENFRVVITGFAGPATELGEPTVLEVIIQDDDFDSEEFSTGEPSVLERFTRALGDDSLDFLGGSLKALAMGDFNDDGFDDLAVGAFGGDKPGRFSVGEVFVLYGNQGAPGRALWDLNSNGAPIPGVLRIQGESELNEFGFSVAAGDINGDRVSDLIVGAWRTPFLGDTFGGKAYVFLGGRDWPSSGVVDASLPDANVGPHMVVTPAARRDFLGLSVASGDLDGDGFDEAILGAPGTHGGDLVPGSTFVVWGSANPPALVNLRTPALEGEPVLFTEIRGPASFDQAGFALGVSDYNADGLADLAIGAPSVEHLPLAPLRGPGQSTFGNVYVLAGSAALRNAPFVNLGAPTLPTPATIYVNDAVVQHFGYSLAADRGRQGGNYLAASMTAFAESAGDPSEQPRVAIFRPALDSLPLEFPGGSASARGEALPAAEFPPQVFLMSDLIASAPDGLSLVFNPEDGPANFGVGLAFGSLEGDGRADLFIGAPDNAPDASGVAGGEGWALRFDDDLLGGILGVSTPDNAHPYANIRGFTAMEGFGFGAAGGGDLDGDGFGDMAFNAPRFDHPDLPDISPVASPGSLDNDAGGVFLYWGDPLSVRAAPVAVETLMVPAQRAAFLRFGPETRLGLSVPADPNADPDKPFEPSFVQAAYRRGEAPVPSLPGDAPLMGTWRIDGPRLSLGPEATAAFRYGQRAVDDAGLDESLLAVYMLDEANGVWIPLAAGVDPGNNTVTAAIPGPGTYGLAGAARSTARSGLLVK